MNGMKNIVTAKLNIFYNALMTYDVLAISLRIFIWNCNIDTNNSIPVDMAIYATWKLIYTALNAREAIFTRSVIALPIIYIRELSKSS